MRSFPKQNRSSRRTLLNVFGVCSAVWIAGRDPYSSSNFFAILSEIDGTHINIRVQHTFFSQSRSLLDAEDTGWCQRGRRHPWLKLPLLNEVSNDRGSFDQVDCSDHARPLAQLCVDDCAKQAVVTDRRRSQVAFDNEDDAAACFLSDGGAGLSSGLK